MRLTKRTPKGKVMLQDSIIPTGCSKPRFCRKKDCPYSQSEDRSCPMLRMIDKLADLEDQIDKGELVEKRNTSVFLIMTSGNKDLNIRVSGVYSSQEKANEALTLTFDKHLSATDVSVKKATLDQENGRFFVEYGNWEIWAAQIICVSM